MKTEFYSLGMMVVIISFFGFSLENVVRSISKGYIDNRNMNLPFLLGYGLAAVGIYVVIGTPEELVLFSFINDSAPEIKTLVYFSICMVLVSVGEIILGTIVEKVCGIEYWNYSDIPLHITKYTSIPTSIGFSLVITLFMGLCFNPILEMVMRIEYLSLRRITIVSLIALTVDMFAGYKKMRENNRHYDKWRIYVRKDKSPDQKRGFVRFK